MTASLVRTRQQPDTIRMAVVNDYDVVLAGVRALLAEHGDDIEIVEMVANMAVNQYVDVALYDAFAQSDADLDRLRAIVANPYAARVVVYTWNFSDQFVESALEAGANGCVAKTVSGDELADVLTRVVAGETVVRPGVGRALVADELDWPGRSHGLTAREAEILSLIMQGLSNVEIAEVVHLSVNTIKGHIRTCYRKIGATNRVDAVLWGTEHGMRPDHNRIETWRSQR